MKYAVQPYVTVLCYEYGAKKNLHLSNSLPVNFFYLETGMLEPMEDAMKTVAQNRPANSKESVLGVHPTFSLVNALVYI